MEWTWLPTPVALAIVALLGYLFGRSSLRENRVDPNQIRRELGRAKAIIDELERISQSVRRSLAAHHSSILHFRSRISELGIDSQDESVRDLCQEAERLLKPTLKLASQMASAYDEIRQQTNMLMTFTEVRTDALTGISNRRALDESLVTMIALKRRYDATFSLVILDIDHFKQINDRLGHVQGDRILQDVAKLIEKCGRDTDIITRYGGEEFVVVLPETDVNGGTMFARRVRQMVESNSPVTISAGVAESIEGDSAKTLLGRADEALYAAKAAGRNRVYQNVRGVIEPATAQVLLAVVDDVVLETTNTPKVVGMEG